MKLKLNLNTDKAVLHEAPDHQLGRRVSYISNFYAALEPALNAAGYRFKVEGDKIKGFHILPKENHLLNIRLVIDENGAVTTYCAGANESIDSTANALDPVIIPAADADTSKTQDNVDNLAAIIAKGCKMALITTDNVLQESLLENSNLYEFANPFAAIKNGVKTLAANIKNNVAAKSADAYDKNQAEIAKKETMKNMESLLKDHIVEKVFDSLSAMFTGFNITKSIKGNTADITIAGAEKSLLSVVLQTPIDTKIPKLEVAALITGDKGKKTDISDRSLEALAKLLNKKLDIKIGNILKALGVEDPAEEKDDSGIDDPNADDNTANDAVNPFKNQSKKSYQMDTILAGLSDASDLTADEVVKLLEESLSMHNNVTLREAKINLSSGNSNNYFEVYREIGSNDAATVALVKRFINKGLNVPEAKVEAIDEKNLRVYISVITDAQFNISSNLNPAAFILSAYLKKWKQLPTQLTQGIYNALIKNSNSVIEKHIKNDCVNVKVDAATFHSIDSIVDENSSESILYCKELNKKADVAKILNLWFRWKYAKAKTVKDISTNAEAKAVLAEICAVEADAVTSVADVYKVIFLKSIDSKDFADAAIVEKRSKAIDQIKIEQTPDAETLNQSEEESNPSTAEDSVEELTIDELRDTLENSDADIEMNTFIKSLTKIINDKQLSTDAVKELQKSILNCFN